MKKIYNFHFTIFGTKISAQSIVSNPLFSGSAVMIVGTNFANFVAYIYHLIIGRLLGPAEYGELAATLSALTLFSTAFSFFGLVITKFVAVSDNKNLGSLYAWFLRRILIVGFSIGFLITLSTPLLANFLHIELATVLLIGPTLFLFLLIFSIRSFLQGLLRFTQVAILANVDLLGRLFLGLMFIYLGFKSFGAVLGLFISSILGVIWGYYYLRDIRPRNKTVKYNDSKKIMSYAFYVFLISIANNSFMSTDVMLAKHYLNAPDAGFYASLSTLGKIIFYAGGPVAAVAFPIIAKKYGQKKPYLSILILSFLMISILGIAILTLYYLLPELMVSVLFGSEYVEASKYLINFGIFILIFTLTTIITSFYLSVERVKIWIIPLIFAIVQIIGIVKYHKDILQIINVSIFSASFLLLSLIIYFVYENRKSISTTQG